jgi:hypothetical protein
MQYLINLGYALVHALLDLARAGVECRRMTGQRSTKWGFGGICTYLFFTY